MRSAVENRHAREPAVQLDDAPHAAAAGRVDQENELADMRMPWAVHDEPHRGPDAAFGVGLCEICSQHDFARRKVELPLLFPNHKTSPRRRIPRGSEEASGPGGRALTSRQADARNVARDLLRGTA